ncbi:MAG TPA: hypothetical protein VF490_21505 [Chryseosolibacter sp.]
MVRATTRILARQSTATQRRRDAYLVWLLSPFLSLVMAVRNYKAAWAKNVLWLFVVFYGFTFVVSNQQIDANRYVLGLEKLSRQDATSFTEFFDMLYQKDTNYVDVLQPLVTFLVSRFTDDGRILYAVFGVIFGYFYSRNAAFLISFVRKKIRKEALIFLITCLFVVSIWQMNGFRFATAAHVFIFGLFNLFNERKAKGVLFCIGSVFVHFSFLMPLIILAIHLLVGNRLFVAFVLYFASFFATQVTPDLLKNYAGYLPGVFQERSAKYTSDAYLEAREELAKRQVNWYVNGRVIALTYATNVLLAIVFIRYRRHFSGLPVAAHLLSFSLYLFAAGNIFSSVPSVGIRFQLVSLMPLFAALFLFVQAHSRMLFSKWVKVPFIAAALLFIIVEIRIGFDTTGVITLIGNPIVAPFMDNQVPLISLIK